jgi:hypothetical protein
MSLLDDDNEIEYSCAIVNARKYVEELYAEADRKRAEIVDHLWELQAKKIGVPQGTTAAEAWGWFRDAITIETQDKAVEMFDVPMSYEKAVAKQQYFEKRCLDTIMSRDHYMVENEKSGKLSWNFAEEILKLVVMCPTLEYSKEVVADALNLIYGSTWKYYVASTFEIEQVPYIIGKCNRDAHKTIGELQKMYIED